MADSKLSSPTSSNITTAVTVLPESLGDNDELMTCTGPDNDKPWLGWRYLDSNVHADLMIISSYGDVHPQRVSVARKLTPPNCTTDRLVLAREELDCVLDLYKQDGKGHIVYCYTDHGSVQFSKEYYLQRMRKLLSECEKELVALSYTGDSETGTGNWCFKDGVITFQDIYDMYVECFKGKRLAVVSDCSYSGSWVKECVKVYDEQGILGCGHHSRERGILLSVYTSCKSHQQATILAYVKEAMKVVVTTVVYDTTKRLSTGQQGTAGHFRMIRCNNQPDQQCQYTDPSHTWENKVLLGPMVHCVRGEDRGDPAWQYVLVDEDKEQAFKDKMATGTVDVADYGKVLYSGWGKDPPQDVKDKIQDRYWYRWN